MERELDPIRLPTWCARFDPVLATARESPAQGPPDETRLGPITVFSADPPLAIVPPRTARDETVLFEGFLFDRASLARHLEIEPPARDAELAAAACRRWGPGALDRIDGVFLLAFWSPAARRLMVARDATGQHPVYYAVEGRRIWFASNVLALAARAEIPDRPDRLTLGLRLALRGPLAGRTCFEEIRRLRPGHYLAVGLDEPAPREVRFFEPFPKEPEPWIADASALEEFEPRLAHGVAQCVEAGATGVLLSGGIDSVSVAALARLYAERRGLPVPTACSGKNPPGYPSTYEERMQDAAAERLGMPRIVGSAAEWLGGRELLPASLEIVPQLPAPTNSWWIAAYTGFYRQIAAAGPRVLMMGSGGDEWLGVHESYAADLIRSLRLAALLRFVRAKRGTGGLSRAAALRDLLLSHGVLKLAKSVAARISPRGMAGFYRRREARRLPAWLCPEPIQAGRLAEALATLRPPDLDAEGRIPASHYWQTALYLSGPASVTFSDLEVRHHVSALCGVRLLSPFHGRTMVSFLSRVSPAALLHADRTKGLLREVVARHLPGLGLEDQRKVYGPEDQTYVGRSLRRQLGAAWRRVGGARLAALGLVDESALGRRIEAASSLPIRELARFYAALSIESWLAARS